MGTTKRKKDAKSKVTSLSHGRPPLAQSQRPRNPSAKSTRTLIRQHHNTLKAHSRAVKNGDSALAEKISLQLTKDSLHNYQLASKTGQSLSRGGDSSKVLVGWLQPILSTPSTKRSSRTETALAAGWTDPNLPLRVLEIGALSTKNAISSYPTLLTVTRIDLNSQEPGIQQQDFMDRPVPQSHAEKFHIISLSLVLNFVSEPKLRGEMLKRCTEFLLPSTSTSTSTSTSSIASSSASVTSPLTPSLFLVLPLPCVQNSRYLTVPHLISLMSSLHFSLLHQKTTNKLYYSLWRHDSKGKGQTHDHASRSSASVLTYPSTFKKKEVLLTGGNRNNFCVLLE